MEGIVVLISAIIDFFSLFLYIPAHATRFLTRFGIRDQEQSDSHVHLFPFLLSINGCLLSCSTRELLLFQSDLVPMLNMVGGANHSML